MMSPTNMNEYMVMVFEQRELGVMDTCKQAPPAVPPITMQDGRVLGFQRNAASSKCYSTLGHNAYTFHHRSGKGFLKIQRMFYALLKDPH